jgi:SGNH hydrolase-like domain, acetyltransferase AlgX
MEILKKVICLFILLLFLFIAIWKQVSAFSSESIHGVYETTPLPDFSVSAFTGMRFQEQFGLYIEDLKGLKGIFSRIRNQIDYSLFSIPHANKIVSGKNGYLFGEENILAYLGKNFAGENYLDVKIKELKNFQDELWKKKKILLLVIFTPDKASFFPELIPDRYGDKTQIQNNYLYYSGKCSESGINLIDFNRYFILAKDTSRYPLFAKTGVHWSSYGALLAADSLIHYLSLKLNAKLPEIIIDRIDLSRVPKDDDDDISRTMNLFWGIPQQELAYPKFHFRSDQTTKRPSALFIGDSYYWNWYKQGIIRHIFRIMEFWYYDQEVYPESFFNKKFTWNIKLKNAIERQNVIILLQTNNWKDYDFGNGFVDRAWPEYDTSANNRIRCIENYLIKGQKNMRIFEKKAIELSVPLEYVIRRDAIYAGNNLLRTKK